MLERGRLQRDGGAFHGVALATIEVPRPAYPVDLAGPGAQPSTCVQRRRPHLRHRQATKPAATFIDAAEPLYPTPLSRAVAVATVRDMLVSGDATAAEPVRYLTGVLGPTLGSVVEPYLAKAADMATLWARIPSGPTSRRG